MKNFLKLFSIIFLFSACLNSNENTSVKQIYYFDLADYFTKMATDLNNQKPLLNKSVTKNDSTESKSIQIKDWKTELALFAEADINKTAWKDSYTKDSTSNKIAYTSKEADLKTQKIEIDLKNGKPVKFFIITQTDNLLFQTKEELTFYPDSVYEIKKYQKVILLGENSYLIKGEF